MANVLSGAEGGARTRYDRDHADQNQSKAGSLGRRSCRTNAASIATSRGITPGNKAPASAAGAKPALVSSTGAPPPNTIAASPGRPRRSSASPRRSRYGSNSKPATPKRIAAMSDGVRLVRRPRRATTIHPDQMLTAAMPYKAPRAYWAVVRSDIAEIAFVAPGSTTDRRASLPLAHLPITSIMYLSGYDIEAPEIRQQRR